MSKSLNARQSSRSSSNSSYPQNPAFSKVHSLKRKWLLSLHKMKPASKHLVAGARRRDDHLIRDDRFVVSGSCFGRKVVYEHTFRAPRNFEITQVRAVDDTCDGNSPDICLLEGGPGYNSVTLRFKSARFHGIHVHVQVFAYDTSTADD